MPLCLSLMTKQDIPAFVEVDDEAMKDYGIARAMATSLPPGMTRKQLIRGFMDQGFKQDDTTVWLKVVDDQTGEFVASALWQFGCSTAPTSGVEPTSDRGPNDGRPLSFHDMSTRRDQTLKQKHLGGDAHATLAILFTGPKHRRRGAANMLVRWGSKRADEKGLASALFASPEGMNVYLKHGFKVVEEDAVDLRVWGVDETVIRRFMVRAPQKEGK